MKKFLKTVFFGFFLCFFKILTPYLMALGYIFGTLNQKHILYTLNFTKKIYNFYNFVIKNEKVS